MAGARAVVGFAGMYVLVDSTLELASEGHAKRPWHHVLASAMAAGLHHAAARRGVVRGAAVGAGLGVVSWPLWHATFEVAKAPSLLQRVLQRSRSEGGAAGGGGGDGAGAGAAAEPATPPITTAKVAAAAPAEPAWMPAPEVGRTT
jgi:hypothetical protein